MCLEKRKLYTVCGHQSSGIRLCHRQREIPNDLEASGPSIPSGSDTGAALTSKIYICSHLTRFIFPATQPVPCRPPHPYFTEIRFGFCCRCQAYYRSAGFAPSESDDTRNDQVVLKLVPFAGEDVGEGIQKLEDIRWKTIMWAEEGRKKREWRGELEEREKEWEKEERGEEEEDEERRDVQSRTGSQHDATTEADEANQITNRALVSSYHNVLTRLAASTSEHQSRLSRSHSEETDLARVVEGEHDKNEHERFHVNGNIVAERNDTTNITNDIQPETSVEDLYSYDYHQLSEILEERSSQFTKSKPSKELSSKPSSGSTSGLTAAGQSPIAKKKTDLSPGGQAIINFSLPLTESVRLTKSNLARLHKEQGTEDEDKKVSPSTIQATVQPLETTTPFCLAGAVNPKDSLGKLTTSNPSQALRTPSRDGDGQEQTSTTSQVTPSVAPVQSSPSITPAANPATTHSIQSWENFTISTPSQSIQPSWRKSSSSSSRAPEAGETGGSGKRRGTTSNRITQLGLNQLVLTTTSPSPTPNHAGRNTPRLRRTPRLQALNEDIYLRPGPEQSDDDDEGDSGSGLGASVFAELSAGIVGKERESEEGKGERKG
ncbi:hypothetical protein GE21DRAFT_280 [Neurospora crassa]|uniref:Uncharacterized protein n=1 Tax=Neurospora crassa (strain ATCC 24698 / 74-OR23-1A / CBS 708.71 / DSM 1257 / FGSC 987) TaxID=367110 RepID=Q7SES0_NEUCR|nr:hypothetical protein NCU02146 [Neurospora crassa OR74A]EAA35269.3 hypothetical protein NCU02146 [Neurospora crassa OR74A]KHE83950.1 hypothetical protein GE21DRAFT_280 [Neurospora crassa]|eukprot:XP_964505.3 hypothetical protein NCU02146 [Neurospora crassa OR74A]